MRPVEPVGDPAGHQDDERPPVGLGPEEQPEEFNSEIGIPLTILGLPNGWNNPLRWVQIILEGLLVVFISSRYPRLLVLEVGADRPGILKMLRHGSRLISRSLRGCPKYRCM